MEVINQTVGDAISDLLIVETILHARGWNIQDWEAAYTDLPSRQLKVVVKVGGIELVSYLVPVSNETSLTDLIEHKEQWFYLLKLLTV
jgi:hypothetical protein